MLFLCAFIITIQLMFIGQCLGEKNNKYEKFFGDNNQVHLMLQSDIPNEQLIMTATFPQESWFGIGFGEKMTSAELVMMIGASDTTLIRTISTSIN